MWAEIANRLDSSPGPLLFEMTTLPTLPQLRLFGSWHCRCHEFESPWRLLEANASFNRNVYQWGRWPLGPCLNAPVSYNLYLDFLQWNFAFVHFAIYSCVDAPSSLSLKSSRAWKIFAQFFLHTQHSFLYSKVIVSKIDTHWKYKLQKFAKALTRRNDDTWNLRLWSICLIK